MRIEFSREEMEQVRRLVVQGLVDELKRVNPSSLRKHAYTVKEVAEQISYTANTVRIFIREGRKDRSGKIRHLPAREITSGDFRILPHELDKWLSYF